MAVCAECTYLDISDGNSNGQFWCDKKLERHLATDIECGYFCKAYSRYSSSINNAIDFSKNHSSSSGCFLTTMLCYILKMDDNNEYLQTMRKFRKDILQKDEKYKRILVEYDIIGPKIANALNNDPLKEQIANLYFSNFIIKIKALIENQNNDEAVNKYIEMTTRLKNFYGISNQNISIEDINNADISKSGHGKYIKKSLLIK